MKKTIYVLMLLFCSAYFVEAQNSASNTNWQSLLEDFDGCNLFEITAAFNRQYGNVSEFPKGHACKAFKRWEAFVEQRLDENGCYDPTHTWNEYNRYLRSHPQHTNNDRACASIANWTVVGPVNPPDANNNQATGRIDCIAFHPTNSTTFWAGAPTGGLWKTTNSGANWTVVNDFWTSLGVSDIAIHPTSPTTMYISTGDRDSGRLNSFGILKSTDGGTTWSSSGLTTTTRFYRLLIHPTTPNILLAATNTGVHRSTDSGATWTAVSSLTGTANLVYDMEFKPTAPSIVYAATATGIYKSVDSGASFSLVQALTGVRRVSISVTPANSAKVYIQTISSTTYAPNGIYVSSDSGASFSLVATDATIVGNATAPYNTLGTAIGSQGYYDCSMAVSPTNANEVWIGNMVLAKSTDGGVSWTYYGGNYHVDIHALEYHPTTAQLYIGCDGGTYRLNAANTIDVLNTGLAVTQCNGLTQMPTPNVQFIGNQDNGGMLHNNGVWSFKRVGDGVEGFVNPINSNILYASIQYNSVYKTTTGGYTSSNILSRTIANNQLASFNRCPLVMDFNNPETLLAGFEDVWKTTNGGTNWTNLSNGQMATGVALTLLKMAPSNANYLYAGYPYLYNSATGVTTPARMYRSTNGGTVWSAITLPTASTFTTISTVEVHNADPNIIWIARSDGKVFKSINGGGAWTDISGTLPLIRANSIAYEPNSGGGLYLAMDLGIYYRNDSMTDWILFSTNLPNVIVSELAVYPNDKIRAATYGRGLWESPLYCTPPSCPIPTNLSVTNITTNSARLNWSAATGAVSYAIQGRKVGAATWSNLTSTSNYKQLGTVLTACKNYEWKVQAVCSAANSDYSPLNTFSTTGCVNMDKGLSDDSNNSNLTLYPNPANHQININFVSQYDTESKISLFDVTGKRVLTQYYHTAIGDNLFVVSTNDLPSGYYGVMIESPEIMQTAKVVVIK